MSSKLNLTLDEILSTQRRGNNGRRSQRRSTGQQAKAAPVGGIHKSAKPARGSGGKAAPSKAGGKVGDSKIFVSNLPKDVSEGQIKEYFGQSVGPVKKVELSYSPGGVSRGIATVIFVHADGASKAFQSLNGLLIDNRPVKVEVVVADATQIPAPKTLSQRVTQPKAQPKSAATDKRSGGAGNAAAKGAKKRGKGRSARPAKKTAEELDSEMADYFGAATDNNAGTAAAGAAVAANGDAPMEDEIL